MDGDGDDETQGQNEIRLRHCLDPRTRRWARAEFFCSALDRPWLENNGVQELCEHCNISAAQLSRLSRREWGCIRKALGRPRRLSLSFLRQVKALPQCVHQPPCSASHHCLLQGVHLRYGALSNCLPASARCVVSKSMLARQTVGRHYRGNSVQHACLILCMGTFEGP